VIKALEDIEQELKKSKTEFDIASTCFVEAIKNFHKRLEDAEKWIEDRKKQTLK
jgi:hypothetical protein